MFRSTRRLGRSALAMAGIGAIVALGLGPVSASPASDSFTGVCDITYTNWIARGEALDEKRTTVVGGGVCSGILNGDPISNAQVRLRATGTLLAVYQDGTVPEAIRGSVPAALRDATPAAPLLGSGRGAFTFVDEAAKIGFTWLEVGVTDLLEGNDGGAAVIQSQPFTEQQPEDEQKVTVRGVATAINLAG